MADSELRGGGARPRSEEGDALLVARTRLGLTQPAFADRLSEVLGRRVDRTQIAKWEAGVYRPRTAVMLAAAALLSVPLHELMADGASLRGPQALRPVRRGGGRRAAPSAALPPAPPDLLDPRAQVRALLELGFSLPEAIELVRSASPETAATGASGG